MRQQLTKITCDLCGEDFQFLEAETFRMGISVEVGTGRFRKEICWACAEKVHEQVLVRKAEPSKAAPHQIAERSKPSQETKDAWKEMTERLAEEAKDLPGPRNVEAKPDKVLHFKGPMVDETACGMFVATAYFLDEEWTCCRPEVTCSDCLRALERPAATDVRHLKEPGEDLTVCGKPTDSCNWTYEYKTYTSSVIGSMVNCQDCLEMILNPNKEERMTARKPKPPSTEQAKSKGHCPVCCEDVLSFGFSDVGGGRWLFGPCGCTADSFRVSEGRLVGFSAITPSPEMARKAKARTGGSCTSSLEQYTDEEREFLQALNEYKVETRRPHPTSCEVLAVLKSLGYVKRFGKTESGRTSSMEEVLRDQG